MTSQLHVQVRVEDNAYWATVDEYPGVFVTGDDLEELRGSLEEAIALYLASPDEDPKQITLGALELQSSPQAAATAALEYA